MTGVGLSTLADALARPTQKHFIPTDAVEPISVLLAAVILFLKNGITLGELMKSIDLMYQTMLVVQWDS